MDLATEQILLGPITKTCPACALVFQVGTGTTTTDSKPEFETSEGSYIRKKDGAVLYFPNRTLLEQWANDGMVRPSDEISKKGGEWEKVGSLSDFKARFIYEESDSQSAASPIDVFDITEGAHGRALWITVMASVLGIIAAWMLISGLLQDDGPAIPDEYLTPSFEKIPDGPPAASNRTGPNNEVENEEPSETPSSAADTEDPSELEDSSEAEATTSEELESTSPPSPPVEEKPARTRIAKPPKTPAPAPRPPPRAATYDQLMSRGSKLLRSNPRLAITTFERALRISPTSEARAKLGRAYLKSGEISLASIHLRQALSLNPKYQPALWDLAQAYTVQGNHRKAIEVYRRLQRLVGPNSAQGQKVEAALSRMGEIP